MTPSRPGGHAGLVENLYEYGLLDETWRAVWHAVPREPFIPRTAWRQGPARCEPLTNEADRLALIHADEPVVIQVDDGEPGGPGVATSSNSQPSMVARMLRLLLVDGGHRVLEIGTASGYVAALLSRRLGDSAVYSVEIDPGLAHHAAATLRAAGYTPNLACADGAWGWPDEAPFDRIVATCALRTVPHQLVRQLEPGGVLVAPVARAFWSGALVQLTADGTGQASGRFQGGAAYMPMRAHRPAPPPPVDQTSRRSVRARVDPRELLTLGFALYAGARLPGVRMVHADRADGAQVWLQDEDGSAATAVSGEDAYEYGARGLWDEVQRVRDEYVALGAPGARDFGLTVSDRGQQVWLHDPERVIEPAPLSEPVR
ncbi:methyltransferase domain-containing protein [Streptomyces ficellus]|uniref:Protein-L-isoaspartate O-methyltransferase n=1 Tax=Streptomyces ficellus TaxID=1977088 RepID=A0A6I6FTL7_9ACTN|nr:methyltransferase domain-containing protein [Streptomyces ficellus]QGV80516.1 methyltransferase [Streptomyces ficellus]